MKYAMYLAALLCGAAFTLSACSSDDEPQQKEVPTADKVVPTQATITFTPSSPIPGEKVRAEVQVPVSGHTFNLPYTEQWNCDYAFTDDHYSKDGNTFYYEFVAPYDVKTINLSFSLKCVFGEYFDDGVAGVDLTAKGVLNIQSTGVYDVAWTDDVAKLKTLYPNLKQEEDYEGATVYSCETADWMEVYDYGNITRYFHFDKVTGRLVTVHEEMLVKDKPAGTAVKDLVYMRSRMAMYMNYKYDENAADLCLIVKGEEDDDITLEKGSNYGEFACSQTQAAGYEEALKKASARVDDDGDAAITTNLTQPESGTFLAMAVTYVRAEDAFLLSRWFFSKSNIK